MWGSISMVAVAGGGGAAALSAEAVWSSTESSEANNMGAV
jgi:hypothetical protein